MAKLLSGSTLRKGGSGEFLDLAGAQPQLPPSPSTSTGFTLITDEFLRTSYSSSLGNVEFRDAVLWSNLPEGVIRLAGTGTGYIFVTSSTQSISTTTGALVVNGGIGVGKSIHTGEDIFVNKLRIGQGFEGTNNIVIQGVAVDNINEFNEGRASVAIGFDALTGLSSSLKNIAIGRYALSSGTNISNSIAIGDSALKNLGVVDKVTIGSIANATLTSPVTIEINNHNITTGTQIYVDGVVGMTELNNQSFWVDWLSSSTLALYTNNILTTPLTATNTYVSSGTVYKVLQRNNNIAIGSNAGSKLMDGVRNFFFGDAVAPNFTTGSNNFFIGHEVATNMTYGNNNIAIGGDNLVNGKDDQVNIGSVFYFDGTGYTQLNSDVGLGLGSESTSTNTGALTVLGGIGLTGNLTVGKNVNVQSTASSTSTTTGAIVVTGGMGVGKNVYAGGNIVIVSPSGDKGFSISAGNYENAIRITHNTADAYLDFGGSLGYGNLYVRPDLVNNGFVKFTGTTSSISTDSGAVQIVGGIGIGENLNVGGNAVLTGSLSVNSITESTTTNSGAAVIQGGVGIGGNLNVGGDATVGSNTTTSTIELLYDENYSGSVYFTGSGINRGIITSNVSSLDLDAYTTNGIRLRTTNTTAVSINNNGVVEILSTESSISTQTGALVVMGGVGIAENINVGGTAKILSDEESTTTDTGALVVTGGVGIGGNLNVAKELNVLGTDTVTITPSGTGDIFLQTRGSGDVNINPDGGGNVYISPSTGDVRIEPVLGGSVYINPSNPGTINNMVIGDAPNGAEDATFKNVRVLSTTTATSTTTGALIVDGGVGIQGDIYSNTGNPDQNLLLYTPRVFITDGTAPAEPRIGDFWIDSSIPAYLQYIRDGTDTFWIQVGAV